MAKISVRHGVARAYGFLFGRLFQVLGLSWLPALFYAVAATYLLQRMSGAMQSAVPADAGLLGEYALFYFVALIAVTAFLGAVIAVPLAREALGLREEPVAVHFVVGGREARLFFGLLRFYAASVAILLLLAVAAGIAITTAQRYAAGKGLHLNWGGVSFPVWLNLGASVAAAVVFLALAVRFGFLLTPVAAAEKHAKLVRAARLSRGNSWRIAFVYIIVGLPATLLLLTCEANFGGLQMGKTLPTGMQAFFTVAPSHFAIFAAILATGLVVLQALFAGASASAYEELADAVPQDASPAAAYREPAMAFADAGARDFGDARPGNHRGPELREDLASRAASEPMMPVFATIPMPQAEQPVDHRDLRVQPSLAEAEPEPPAPELPTAVEHTAELPQTEELPAADEHAETASQVDGEAEHAGQLPVEHVAETPPLDPVGAMAAPHDEYTPPG